MSTLVTIEGADTTGKSTVHRGFQDQASDEYVSGLVDRLQTTLDEDVHPSREPGSYSRNKGLWWKDRPHVDLERHLQAFERYAAWAIAHTSVRSGKNARLARDVMIAACFVNAHGALPDCMFDALLEGESLPGLYAEELQTIYQNVDSHIDLLDADPTLGTRVRNTTARNLLRLALMKPDDELNPTAAGLTFFAGHVLHADWAGQKDGIIVSDRAGESQKAYGAARGDDPRVVQLYEHHEPLRPDLVVLLTCGRDAVKRRLKEESPEEDWAGLGLAMSVQAKYQEILQRTGAPPHVQVDTTGRSPETVIEEVTERVLQRLSHNRSATSVSKTAA